MSDNDNVKEIRPGMRAIAASAPTIEECRNAAPTVKQCHDIVQLQGTIEGMDERSQEGFERIQSLVSVCRKALDKLTDELPVGAERAFLFDLDRTLEMIRDIAADAENEINGAAEKVGCNYVGYTKEGAGS